MTTAVKLTKIERELVQLLHGRTEPMTTRELQRAFAYNRPAFIAGKLEQLEARGCVTSSRVLDGLERAWRPNP